VGINWSPLLDPNAAPSTAAYAQPTTVSRTGEVTKGSTVVTGIDVSGLVVGMPVTDNGIFSSAIASGTTIASIDAKDQTITLSLPATGTSADTRIFRYTAAQFVVNQFQLQSSTRTVITPAAPVPLAYARQFSMGSVTDTGSSLSLTVGPKSQTAIAALTFNPQAGQGLMALGAGMDLQVSFSGLKPGNDVQLIVWLRGIASAPRIINVSGQDPPKTTSGSTIGAMSIPLLTMNASAAGTSTQAATISLGGLLNSFVIEGPFNALNGGSSMTVVPTLGFTVVGNPGSPVTVTVNNMRQFMDGIIA
jgi:hypothetical protein